MASRFLHRVLARRLVRATLLSLPAAAIGAEVYLRLFRNPEFRRPTTAEDGTLWKNIVHRSSGIPGLDYEMKPFVKRTVNRMVITTNSLGMRDVEPLAHRGPEDTRILAIGDSVTFGMHVPGDATWPKALEARMNSGAEPELARTRHRYEVLNMGVSGYSTYDEALLVRYGAMTLDPDLVIIGYYLNDAETEPVQQLHQHFRKPVWWEHSTLLRFLAFQKRTWDQERLGGGDVFRYLNRDTGKWQSVVDGFADIARSTSQRGARVLLAVLPTLRGFERWEDYPYADLHAHAIEAGRAAGFETVDVLPAWRESGKSPAELRVDEEHPNALGHALIAEAVLRKIVACPALLSGSGFASATGRSSRPPSR